MTTVPNAGIPTLRSSALTSGDLSGLPATKINAPTDPLEAGVDVNSRVYEGVSHECLGRAAILEQAKKP
ncbi:hypothetical protein [Neolewinella xylanilytica]|uniref:hypothetical protein n=1 Tax=Neolewinella xylanilytica TaxID=1514080 RepID=UPI0011B002E7|nr:hypothetical protein [Neolewinella xylanilytica]